MTITKARFENAIALVKEHIPALEILYKDTSWLMKVLGFLSRPFNKEFMTRYTTTFRHRVYYPSPKYISDSYERALEILMHEFVHLWDRKQMGDVAYALGYMFPQWLALIPLVLTAMLPWFISPAWLVILVGLVLSAVPLCPWPAPFRTKIELRGYVTNMAFHFWLNHDDDMIDDSKWITSQFTGWGYYRMAPNKRKTLDKLMEYTKRIRTNTLDEQPYPIVQSIIQSCKGEKK